MKKTKFYINWPLLLKSICWISAFNLYFPVLPLLATTQTSTSVTSKAIAQQRDLIKCGYRQKEVTWQLPSKKPGNNYPSVRVDREVRRCADTYLPAIPLTALVPDSPISITIAPYPVLFFYIPETDLDEVEFTLVQDETEIIYRKTLSIRETDRIVKIDLSDSPVPLELGKPYAWYFLINFNRSSPEDAVSVFGWIERIEPDAAIKRQLEAASPQEQPAIYAANGVWFDALARLAELRCSSPNNSSFTSDWESLLQQVGLVEVSRKPLAQCPQAKAL